MKNLKNYIKNYINESVWDIENNVESDNEEFIIDKIKKFIKDNYGRINMDRCKIIFDEKKNKYIINCDQPVFLNSGADQLANDFFEWGTVKGWFNRTKSLITSLKGAPKKVEGAFVCTCCPNLTSLKGAPAIVKGNFYCFECPKLKSLQGTPEEVSGNFHCYECSQLKSLKGVPKTVGGSFNCAECPELE